MRIKIIRGIYGHREKGSIVEKSPKSVAFDVDSDEGMRLVSLGVAKEVGEGKGDWQGEENCEEPEEDPGDGFPEALEEMGIEELRKIAGEMGLKKNGSKEELADRIRERLEMEEEEDGEMPELHPAEVE